MASGLLSGGEATSVLTRAMVSCLGCYGLGMAAGYVFEFVAIRVVERERALRGAAERRPKAPDWKTSSEDS
jgi:hypothetical protein